MFNTIMALILSIAAEAGIPPYFALAIALEENYTLNPLAVGAVNENGTFDRGVMQLNSGWFTGDWQDPETNIRAGCLHIKSIMGMPEINTYWDIAAAYNCGYARFISGAGPPIASVNYAGRVMERWLALENLEYINPVIRGGLYE